jgi:exopolysaccharide biosynthesis operon protein EpsL
MTQALSWALSAAIATLSATLAYADTADTITLSASESLTMDDNVFRLPSGVHPSGIDNEARSDQVRVETVGVAFRKAYSLQRVQIDAGLADYRFKNHGFLDFTATNAAASWAWSLTPQLKGNFSFDRRQSLNSFADFRDIRERNVNTATRRRADLEYSPGGNWHLMLGAFWNKSQNNVAFLEAQDYENTGAEAGMRFESAEGNYLAWQWRSSDGRYPRAQQNPSTLSDEGFHQQDLDILGRWAVSGHSLVTGRLTAFRRSSDNYSLRDYQGTAGRLEYTWSPTLKTQFVLVGARDYSSYQALNASYAVTDSISLASNWQAGSKTLVRLKFERAHKDFRGSPGLASGHRDETQRGEQVSVDWTACKALTLGAVLRHEARRSTVPGLDYDDTSATISARLAY